ncbi:hypothetical protein [Psychromicrobium xiongbiense]|uniref:hypothetical protein n=1 Tax=Psychromicrobium xiongbiense TaxID=3051184 RepID=UPI002552EF4C|nr:hypothetical protein [Psychromicrobium sp. YIM S02556]
MLKRIFWLCLGAAIGIMVFRKVSSTGQTLGPAGLNRAVGRFSDSVHDFSDAVRSGMSSRETELRQALGLDETR